MLSFVFPENLSPGGKIPLYMLHGYGSNEVDLFMLNDRLPEKYFPVSFRAPFTTPYGGYAWYALYVDGHGQLTADEKQMEDAVFMLKENIEAANRRFGFTSPVNILGFSQGSILSYLFMSYFPEETERLVAFSGYIHEPLMKDLTGQKTDRIRIFASHGLYDDIIPVEWARRIPDYLKERNIRHVYKEYPTGHYLTEENIADAVDFLR